MKKLLLLLLCAATLVLNAAPVTYNVDIDTSSITNPTSGYVYFELGYSIVNPGDLPSPSGVSITAFTPQSQLGLIDAFGTTGSLATTLAIGPSDPLSYYAQEFTFDGTPIHFQLTFNALPGGQVPSFFNVALQDQVGGSLLSTDDPSGLSNVLTATFNNRGAVQFNVFNLESGAPAATLSQVPEPATLLLTAIPLGAFALLRRRR